MSCKLKLDVADLTVRSFETTAVSDERGTVQGREAYFAPTEFTRCDYVSRCCYTRNTCTTNLC